MTFKNIYIKNSYISYQLDTFTVNRKEIIQISGPSGCGKTSFLKSLINYSKFYSSECWVNNINVNALELNKRKSSILFQELCLLENLTLKDNLCIGPGVLNSELITSFQLQDHLNSKVCHLSGGQQQRAALLRNLIHAKELILLDEPFKEINTEMLMTIKDCIKKMVMAANLKIIYVSHHDHKGFYSKKVDFLKLFNKIS